MRWMATGQPRLWLSTSAPCLISDPGPQRPLHGAGGGLQALVHLHDVNSPRWNRKTDPIAGQSSNHRCYHIITDSFAVVKASPDSDLALAIEAQGHHPTLGQHPGQRNDDAIDHASPTKWMGMARHGRGFLPSLSARYRTPSSCSGWLDALGKAMGSLDAMAHTHPVPRF